MPDYRITIDVKNVARGDITSLCKELMENYGADFDAARGEFVVRTYTREGRHAANFEFDWEDNDA